MTVDIKKPYIIDIHNLYNRFIDTYDMDFIPEDNNPASPWSMVCAIYKNEIKPNLKEIITMAIKDAIDNDLAWTVTGDRIGSLLEKYRDLLVVHDARTFKYLHDEIFYNIITIANEQLSLIINHMGYNKDRDSFRWRVIEAIHVGGFNILVVADGGDYRINKFHELQREGKIDLGLSKTASTSNQNLPKRTPPPTVHIRQPRKDIQDILNEVNKKQKIKDSDIGSLHMGVTNEFISNNKDLLSDRTISEFTGKVEEFDNSVYTPVLSNIKIDTTGGI